jgi:preprotein translocase subunit SecG
MSVINSIWLIMNIILILLILIRSPNEQSLQETLGPLKLFDSSGNAEKSIDNLIKILIICYFLFGFVLTSKAF